MTWRVANSLLTLRDQVNAKWPHRRKDSDGTIGNAEHASRTSDHNPWVTYAGIGIVTAMDITHDPASGCDSYKLAQALLDARDPRIKYVISNRRIAAGDGGPQPWTWRPYTGANPHNHHCHISVKEDHGHFDDTRLWQFNMGAAAPPLVAAGDAPFVPAPPTVRIGSAGPDVERLQKLLGAVVTGKYDPRSETEWALRLAQTRHGLVPDGECGPQTWKAIDGKIAA
jgi:hypothetical protein